MITEHNLLQIPEQTWDINDVDDDDEAMDVEDGGKMVDTQFITGGVIA